MTDTGLGLRPESCISQKNKLQTKRAAIFILHASRQAKDRNKPTMRSYQIPGGAYEQSRDYGELERSCVVQFGNAIMGKVELGTGTEITIDIMSQCVKDRLRRYRQQ